MRKGVKKGRKLYMNKDNKTNISHGSVCYFNHRKSKYYFSYGSRVFIYSVCFIIFIFIGTMFLIDSLTFSDEKVIEYYESSDLDYKVYLKDNDFYDSDYLGKDMIYVANLIDYIHIDFNYDFSIEEDSDIDFSYDIIGKLIISDSLGENNYYVKEYTLLGNKEYSMRDDDSFKLEESLDIDYGYYNEVANSFKSSYGVDTMSSFVVYLSIHKSNVGDDSFEMDSSNVMLVKIPLSEKAINIGLDYKDIDTASSVVSKSSVGIRNAMFMILAVLFIVLALVIFIKLFRLLNLVRNGRSYYDKYVGKLLREYDRLIVETSTPPTLVKCNVIKVSKFSELLDVRDNLKLPVMYYVVTKHQKCYFYIKNGEDIYLTTIKAVDLGKE